MLRIILCNLLILYAFVCAAQQKTGGIVADAETKQPLPFATIRLGNTKQGLVTDMDGHFSAINNATEIHISYIGFETRKFTLPHAGDTFFLAPLSNTMGAVVVKPPYDKIRRIINLAIDNKDQHDPDKYDWYRCNIYYKLKIDYLPDLKLAETDSTVKDIAEFSEKSHLLFTENYTQRTHKHPQQVQDIILASRWSGLKKTYFTTLITDILPFDIYSDFIKLNGKDYLHPVSKGWQQRYEFGLADELLDGTDTIFILNYRPKKNVTFNSLKGVLYINSMGYAISHFTANTDDTSAGRYVKMEQVYAYVEGKWFPRELNYDFVFKKYPSEKYGMMLSGHSVIDSVSFTEDKNFRFDKAHHVKMQDSVDAHSAEQWQAYRADTLTEKEKFTYRLIDSVMESVHAEKYLVAFGKAVTRGMLPIGPIDIDIKRLLTFNNYESIRLGIGLYTNEKLSKYFAVGGWFGYGFKDKVMKYGANARIYPAGNKEHWVDGFYQKNYQNTGSINFHRELDRNTLRQWLLAQVDLVEEYGATAHTRMGYWELEVQGKQQTLTPQYSYSFNEPGTTMSFDLQEGSVGLRYAFGEKRTPAFGFYIPASTTKYPIAYLRISAGNIASGTYETQYYRALAAVTYKTHINRWGTDRYRLEGGLIQTTDDKALPRSFLLAGNGYRMSERFQWYAWGGFITLFPYSYFSDRYASLLYMHDFDKKLFKLPNINPYLSIAHNMLWGELSANNMTANPGIESPSGIYHESGLIINHLLKYDFFNFAFMTVNIGAFYHWSPTFDWQANGRFIISTGFDI